MSSLIGTASDITLALQNRITVSDTMKDALQVKPGAENQKDTKGKGFDEAAARKAADKFESLLIHSMLKSMRKTTMSEDTSNQRALYDDMLDEKLADTMIQSGGIGISDQIVEQIKQQQSKLITADTSVEDTAPLRELARQIDKPVAGNESDVARRELIERTPTATHSATGDLSFATGLWSGQQFGLLSTRQRQFVEPLVPYARLSAQRLGTSTNAVLAIAALETGWGRSMITDKQGNDSHNLFGIKATESDNRYATTLTTEYVGGIPQKQQANFKTYPNQADAVIGFADFIQSNPRYSKALEHGGDPERFLQELQRAGYATDPRYADKAISIMRQISGHTQPL